MTPHDCQSAVSLLVLASQRSFGQTAVRWCHGAGSQLLAHCRYVDRRNDVAIRFADETAEGHPLFGGHDVRLPVPARASVRLRERGLCVAFGVADGDRPGTASRRCDFLRNSRDSRGAKVHQAAVPDAEMAANIGDGVRCQPDVVDANRPLIFDSDVAEPVGVGESSPIGHNGSTRGATDRDQRGRFVHNNRAALVVGNRSAAFWRAADAAQHEIVSAIISDAGYSESDAPRALALAATSVAQSALIADSAFDRLVESGGALSSTGRARRSFLVWLSATDRKERNLRLVGLRRVPKAARSFAEFLSDTAQAEGIDADARGRLGAADHGREKVRLRC